jgi:hypothetical protein
MLSSHCFLPGNPQVRLQTSMHGGVATGAAGYKFPTTLKEGLTLWKGVGPAITRGVICGSVWLGTNEYFKRLLGAKESEPFGPGTTRTHAHTHTRAPHCTVLIEPSSSPYRSLLAWHS